MNRDIKKSFRLPAELNERIEDLKKRDKFKIYSFSDIAILALDQFYKKYSNNGKETLISDNLLNEEESNYKKEGSKHARKKK